MSEDTLYCTTPQPPRSILISGRYPALASFRGHWSLRNMGKPWPKVPNQARGGRTRTLNRNRKPSSSLVFKAHRLVYHSTLGWSNKEEEEPSSAILDTGHYAAPNPTPRTPHRTLARSLFFALCLSLFHTHTLSGKGNLFPPKPLTLKRKPSSREPDVVPRAPRGTSLNLRTTTKQKCGALPRRARIEGSQIVLSTLGARVSKKSLNRTPASREPDAVHAAGRRGAHLDALPRRGARLLLREREIASVCDRERTRERDREGVFVRERE